MGLGTTNCFVSCRVLNSQSKSGTVCFDSVQVIPKSRRVRPSVIPQPSCQGSSVSPPPLPAETVEGNVKTNDDLMMALQASRDQVPALNFHGVCVLLVLHFNSELKIS